MVCLVPQMPAENPATPTITVPPTPTMAAATVGFMGRRLTLLAAPAWLSSHYWAGIRSGASAEHARVPSAASRAGLSAGRGRLREVRRRRVSRPGYAQPLRPVSAHRRVGRGVGGRPPEGRRAPARLRAVCESGRERPAQALLPPCGPAQARWTCACPSGGPGRASPASAVSHPISPRTGVPPGTTLARYPPRRTEIRVAWLDEIARLQHPKPRSREARYLEARQPCERVSDSQPPSGLA